MLENITIREKLKGTDPPATKQAHHTISKEIVRSLVLFSCLFRFVISMLFPNISRIVYL